MIASHRKNYTSAERQMLWQKWRKVRVNSGDWPCFK